MAVRLLRAVPARCLGGLLIVFLAGKVFSKLTLRFIQRADLNSAVNPAEAVLRRYDRRLINFAGAYYYISLPFVIFLVLVLTAAIVCGFLYLGHIPIKLVAILVIGAIVTVYRMIHSRFVRVTSEEPGRSLSSEEAPGLWSLIHEVAEKLGTRPLADRFRLANRVICQNQPPPSGSVWDLFADREAISSEMSSQIEKMVKASVE